MTGWGIAFVAGCALACAATTMAAGPPAARPYTAGELLQKAVDESDVVLLARVRIVAPDTFPAPGGRRRPASLEPIEWLKGGLDGESIDVFGEEGDGSAPVDSAWRALAGVDTLGALVLLRRDGADWLLRRDVIAGFPGGFRPVGQSRFRTVRDSVRRANEGLVIDSLLARADLVVFAGPADSAAARAARVTVERTLAGSVPREPLVLRLPAGAGPPGRGVWVLRDVGGAYEPVPFHRVPWLPHPQLDESIPAAQARLEAGIAAAVARLAARVEDR